jgi:hypothetical protein
MASRANHRSVWAGPGLPFERADKDGNRIVIPNLAQRNESVAMITEGIPKDPASERSVLIRAHIFPGVRRKKIEIPLINSTHIQIGNQHSDENRRHQQEQDIPLSHAIHFRTMSRMSHPVPGGASGLGLK